MYTGLIDVLASNVILQDLQTIDSSGGGIRHESKGVYSYLTVQRVRIHQTAGSGMSFSQTVTGTFLLNSEIDESALKFVDGLKNSDGSSITNWGACVANAGVVSKNNRLNGAYIGNLLYNCGGEGMNVLKNDGVIIRDNTIWNSRRVAIYADNAQDVVIENNLITGWGYRGMNGNSSSGVSIGVEDYCSFSKMQNSVGIVVRNNRMVNVSKGIGFFLQDNSPYNCAPGSTTSPSQNGYKVGVLVYGNSIFTNRETYYDCTRCDVNNNVDKISIKDNLFDGTSVCSFPTLPAGVAEIDSNQYGQQVSDVDCRGTNQILAASGAPVMANGGANLQTYVNGKLPTIADTTPSPKRVAAQLNTTLNGTGTYASWNLGLSKYPQQTDAPSELCKAADAEFQKMLTYDIVCAVRGASTTAGAVQ
jgi:hypothetical protein